MSSAPAVSTPAPATSEPVQDAPAAPAHPKIFAGNLSFAVTEEGLKEFFAVVASDISSVQIIQHNHRSAGYGFVTVSNDAAVDKAIAELNGKELSGRTVNVAKAKDAEVKTKERAERKPKKRVNRRNGKAVPGEVTDAEAAGETDKAADAGAASSAPATDAAATPAEGQAKPKKAKKARKPKKKAASNETPAAEGDAAAAPAEGAAPATTPAAPKPKKQRAPRPPRVVAQEGQISTNVVFVANLTYNTDDAALTELFTAAGIQVVSARVIRKYMGHQRRSKGFGFVDVGDEASQTKAIELLDGKEIGGRNITVAKSIVHTELPASETAATDDVSKAADGVAALSVDDAATKEEEARAPSPETTVLAK